MLHNIDRFIAGSEEIDRQREVITRTMRLISDRLDRHAKEKKWDFCEIIFSVPIAYGSCCVDAIHYKDSVCFECKPIGLHDSNGESLKFELVPTVFRALPDIVERANAIDPGLNDLFEWFEKQSPIGSFKAGMTIGQLFSLLEAEAKKYREDLIGSIVREREAYELSKSDNAEIGRKQKLFKRFADAVLVDFINHVALGQGVDRAERPKDIRR
jgi:hypothetical protein